MIAALAERGGLPTSSDAIEAVRQLWRTDPCGGSTAASARIQCSSAVGMYFRRYWLGEDWQFLGCEVDLGGARADLVWRHRHTGAILVDELKSTIQDLTYHHSEAQLLALALGGRARYGDLFVGVRYVPISFPHLAALLTARDGHLVEIDNSLLSPEDSDDALVK